MGVRNAQSRLAYDDWAMTLPPAAACVGAIGARPIYSLKNRICLLNDRNLFNS